MKQFAAILILCVALPCVAFIGGGGGGGGNVNFAQNAFNAQNFDNASGTNVLITGSTGNFEDLHLVSHAHNSGPIIGGLNCMDLDINVDTVNAIQLNSFNGGTAYILDPTGNQTANSYSENGFTGGTGGFAADVNGNVTATSFTGNGSGITGLPLLGFAAMKPISVSTGWTTNQVGVSNVFLWYNPVNGLGTFSASYFNVGSNFLNATYGGKFNASGAVGQVPANAIPGAINVNTLNAGSILVTNGETTANTTGSHDALVASFANAAQITDPQALDKLDKFVRRLRTMQAFTNLAVCMPFNSRFNPSNNIDLLGNSISWRQGGAFGTPGFDWGATLYLTNQGQIVLPAWAVGTNWTICVVKRDYWAGFYEKDGISFSWNEDFALENTNSDSFNFISSCGRGITLFAPTYNGCLAWQSNQNNNASYQTTLSGAGRGSPDIIPPALWTFSASGGNNIYGQYDTLPIFGSASGTTNLVAAPSTIGLTNFSPVQLITLGGSTNWAKLGTNWLDFPTDTATNGWCEISLVCFFNSVLSSNDLNIFYSAQYELYPTKKQWVGLGDSMVAGDNNYVNPFASIMALTNFSLFYFAQHHPQDGWHDWAQGGSTLISFTNNLPTRLVKLMPSDCDVTIIEDFPRNDLLLTNAILAASTSSNTYASMVSNVVFALTPWTGPNVKIWQYESPLPSTNALPSLMPYGTNLIIRTNLVLGYAALHTNSIFNKFIHTIAYFNGFNWDTNAGFYGANPQGGAFGNIGFHIENTNSPLFHRVDGAYWDTGEWAPSQTNVQIQ